MYVDEELPDDMEERLSRQSASITSPENSRPWDISGDPYSVDGNATDSDLYGDQGGFGDNFPESPGLNLHI